MRVSYKDALARGWIKSDQVPKAVRTSSATRGGKTAAKRAAEADAPAIRLWNAVKHLPGATQEHPGVVPGRKFRIDVAFPAERLAVEIDGWAHHGLRLSDFQRDRERQNLLALEGWRVLRYTAGQIRHDLAGCVAQVERALAAGRLSVSESGRLP